MKCKLITIFCFTLLINAIINIQINKVQGGPPRANDLTDHFGTNPSSNNYGPRPPVLGVNGDLMRQGMLSGIPISPIKNFEQEINPKDVVAGDLLNTAPDASKIVNAHLASKYNL